MNAPYYMVRVNHFPFISFISFLIIFIVNKVSIFMIMTILVEIFPEAIMSCKKLVHIVVLLIVTSIKIYLHERMMN